MLRTAVLSKKYVRKYCKVVPHIYGSSV